MGALSNCADHQLKTLIPCRARALLSIVDLFKLEMQLQDALVEAAAKAAFVPRAIIPFFVEDAEGQVLVGRPAHEPDQAGILFARRGVRLASTAAILPLDLVSGRTGLVNEVGIEDIELIALDHLGRRIVIIIVRLVVLVPVKAHLDTVEVSRLARPIFPQPDRLHFDCDFLFSRKHLLVFLYAARSFSFIQRARCQRNVPIAARLGSLGSLDDGGLRPWRDEAQIFDFLAVDFLPSVVSNKGRTY